MEDNAKVASAGIYEAYYSESNEIILDYQFNMVDPETFEVERYRKKARLIPDERGKYMFGYIEEEVKN